MASSLTIADEPAFSARLKYHAMMSMAHMIKEKAEKELNGCGLDASERITYELNKVLDSSLRRSNGCLYRQSAYLWQKCAAIMIQQEQYEEAANCLRYLSEVQYNYGAPEDKQQSLKSLLNASKFYKESLQMERAVITRRQALAMMELRHKDHITELIDSYQECSALYKSMDNALLQHLSLAVKNVFVRDKKTHHQSEVEIISSISSHKACLSSADIDNNASNTEPIDDKQLVWQQIRQLQTKSKSVNPSDSSHNQSHCETSDSDAEESKQTPKPSKKLLIQNLKKLREKHSVQTSDDEQSLSEIEPDVRLSSVEKEPNISSRLTTEITPASPERSQPKAKKPRKKKSPEESALTPQKRLNKLDEQMIEHYFIIDPFNPDTKLLCVQCDESIQCYRWTTVTDHLDSKRHTRKVMETKLEESKKAQQYLKLSGYQYVNQNYIESNGYQSYASTSSVVNTIPLSDQFYEPNVVPNQAITGDQYQTYYSMTAPTDPSLYNSIGKETVNNNNESLKTSESDISLFFKDSCF